VSSTTTGPDAWSWLDWSHQSWERHGGGRPGLWPSCSERTLPAYAWDTAARLPDKRAVSIDGESRTFAELRDTAAVIAGWLRGRVRFGDRILLVAPTSTTWVEMYVGVLAAGAAVVLANPASSRHELEHMVADSGAALVISDAETADRCEEVDAPMVRLADRPWVGSAAAVGPHEALTGSDLALLAYTSGTTGQPKGVPLTHALLVSSIAAALHSWQWSAQDVVVHALPLYHQHGLGALHAAMYAGSSAALLSHFDPARLAATAREAGATVLFAIPAIYRRLVDVVDTLPAEDSAALRALRLRICGSAPLEDDLAADIVDRLGAPALVRYGLTESGLDVSQPLGHAGPGTIGLPLPWVELRLVHQSREVGPGVEGEVQLRGPQVFDGYWRNPEATSEAVIHDGWFRTGDIAILDSPEAQLRICGRSKELIITGGLNVYPREVELVLEAHPDVVEAGVAGVPDARWGERVTAWVVGRDDIALDIGELLEHTREHLAPYKCPKQVHVVADLPRTPMGKLQRSRLAPPLTVEEPR
jgi:malonyl-CoA/methylmalonyl-CoA synthetase